MGSSICIILLISFLCVSPTLQAALDSEKEHGNVKTLSYTNSVRQIVKDLIANWNSPIVYLKNRGYLNAPHMGLDTLLGKHQDNEVRESKDGKNAERVVRSFGEEPSELGNLFRTFFSSSDNNASDKIKSKLDVPWDLNALKNSVRSEVSKFYDKFYEKFNDKRNEHATNSPTQTETDIDRQVAQMYPSVVFTPSKEHAVEEVKKDTGATAAHMEPKLSKGIAKLLISRTKPLPMQLKEPKIVLEDQAKPAL